MIGWRSAARARGGQEMGPYMITSMGSRGLCRLLRRLLCYFFLPLDLHLGREGSMPVKLATRGQGGSIPSDSYFGGLVDDMLDGGSLVQDPS